MASLRTPFEPQEIPAWECHMKWNQVLNLSISCVTTFVELSLQMNHKPINRSIFRGTPGSLCLFVICHGGCINLYYQSVIPSPYTKWYHKSYYIIVWVLMEIVYSIFIGRISSKIASKIVGIGFTVPP